MSHLFRGAVYRISAICIAAAAALSAGSSFSSLPRSEEPFIHYEIALKDARLNVVTVRARIFGVCAKRVALRSVGDASGRKCEPIAVRAEDSRGAPLAVRPEGERWIVECRGGDFIFEYDVVLTIEDRYSPDVRTMITFLGPDHSRILGRDVFLIPEIVPADGILVDVAMGQGGTLAATHRSVRNRIVVPDLAELPLMLAATGDYRMLSRTVGSLELVLAIAEGWSASDEELFDVVCRIVSEEVALFGSSPKNRYLFVCDGNPVGGGKGFDYYGIHYGGNMILLLDPGFDRAELMDAPMAVIAHEFFHNWNGEALCPRGDDFLWFTEGVTAYFSYRVLERANVITSGRYEGRRRAIEERYRANRYASTTAIGDAANSDLSDRDMVNLLYDGGFLAAEALDRRIADETGGRVSLIDVLRRMYEDAPGGGTADEASFLRAVAELSGKDFSAFVRDLVHAPAPSGLAGARSSLE